MNRLNEDPYSRQTSFEKNRDRINLNEEEINKSDGGEFLDDAIRMIDQPLGIIHENGQNNRGDGKSAEN